MKSKKVNWLAKNRFKSLFILLGSVLIQVVSFILILVLDESIDNPFQEELLSAVGFTWFLFPLASILGVIAGFLYQKENGISFFAIIGIILNLIWVLFFVLIFVLVVVVGVTA